ncbi:LOW QUALITY PROTEIN: AUGMIN subunit 8-like [Telopea speciosissima]|uniref:LOW QUALITY PROTEIN: AUGMIN subunit 8-like n=1 Tax=Telopea speciosissima TaxID=54955 RepID=UPI001CC7EF2E|nr:LOW QUALITY PROTEIN: AUGMIN subunit 8-like [Telopea speciosissima]
MKNLSMWSELDGVNDVCEAELGVRKGEAVETTRRPLFPSEKNNAVTRRSKTREVTSRYKAGITSPSLSTAIAPRRCPSPSVTRTSATSPSFSKRSLSAERRRPATPPSSSRPSTPVQESSAEMHISSRRLMGGRAPEGLWPSTMRSLSVSFQSDTFSLPITKREKPVTQPSSDHTLKPSANVAHKQAETHAVRKATPERKRTPLRGKNTSDQSENSRPVDNSSTRVVDQQLWPGRTGGKVSAGALTRSVDLTEKSSKAASLPFPVTGVSPRRRASVSDGLSRPLEKSVSDTPRRLSFDLSGRMEIEMYSGISSSSAERTSSFTRSRRTQSLPIPVSLRLPSPSSAPVPSSTTSRAMLSPSRSRPSSPCPSVSSLTSRCSNSSSVLSFIADVRKGKKAMNHIEDAHQLRLLYNRHLQWRFANARADTALCIQKMTAEKTLFNVWGTTSELRDSVTVKRINFQQLRQELKLNSVLNEQMAYLDDWVVLERDHLCSLAGATEALEACTLRIPVSGGARANIITVKEAICSALDVMQAMGSSICSLLSRVEGINHLVSELANVAAQERNVLDECRDLLASTAAMQMEENSLRIHLIQLKQALHKGEQPLLAVRTLV